MRKIVLAFSFVLFAAFAFAQGHKDIKINDATLVKVGNEAVLTFTLYTNKCVKSNQLMTLQPKMEYNGQSVECVGFEVSGRQKAKTLRRKETLTGTKSTVNRYGVKNKVEYTFRTPYSANMVNAKLKIKRSVENCCVTKNLSTLEVPLKIDPSMTPAPVVPMVTKRVTPKETKINIKLDEAVSFKVGKSALDMELKNNKESAQKVIAEINEIRNKKGAKITEISIAGFASPEGSINLNNRLSQERAVSFMEAIIAATDLEKWMFKAEVGGENWEQLRSLVENSTLKNKEAIVKIIDSVEDPVERQAKLQSTAGYSYLLKNFYPQLRNAGFVKINYTVAE